MEKSEVLRKVELFLDLNDREIQTLAGSSKEENFADGNVIFKEGDTGGKMYIITEGNVKIYKTLLTGQRKTLASLKPGDLFGELAVFDGLPRSATAVASGSAALISIETGGLTAIFRANAEMGIKIMASMIKNVSKRLRVTDEKFDENVMWNITAKL